MASKAERWLEHYQELEFQRNLIEDDMKDGRLFFVYGPNRKKAAMVQKIGNGLSVQFQTCHLSIEEGLALAEWLRDVLENK